MRDIKEMAREAGFETMLRKGRICGFDRDGDYTEELEHFAELVRADAIAEEREACAYRAGIALLGADRGLANRVDQAIRARSNT